jgi:hypothetical protein
MKVHKTIGVLMVHTANGESIAEIQAKKKATLEASQAKTKK